MAFQRIRDDAYIRKVRELFASMYGRDLEIVLWQEGSKVCNDAFFVRTINYHNCMLPWIESVFSVAGASVLEIGCGSGAATLAVAQRCAQIDSFDIDAISLGLARERA